MSFTVLPLEERIVFNAVIDGIDTDNSGNDSPAPDDQAHEPNDNTGQSEITDDGTGGAESQSAAKILLVSSAVDPALASAASSDVIVILYDADSSTTETLLAQLLQALNGRKAESIGIAAHGGDGSLVLARNTIVNTLTLSSQQDFWTAVGDCLTGNGRVDLLSCNLASTASGGELVSALESLTGRNFAASDNLTGSSFSGGDWKLETDDVDVSSVYFDADKLDSFRGAIVDIAPYINGFMWENYPNYNLGGSPSVLDVKQTAYTVDSDSTGYGGAQGFLKIQITMNGTAADALSLKNFGHTDGYSISGNELYKNATLLGQVSGGTAGNPLLIDWTAAATDADVTYFLRRAQFSTTDAGAGPRNVDIYVSDAAGNGNAWSARMLSVYINGPAVERAISSSIPSAGAIVGITSAVLNATDPDNPGANNLTYSVFNQSTLNGSLWVNRGGTMWEQANWGSFTQEEVNNGWVEYRHTSGSPLHDRFSFYVTDNTGARSPTHTLFFTGGDTAPSVTIDSAMQNTNMTTAMEMSCAPMLTISDDSYTIRSLTFQVRSRPDTANERIFIHPDQVAMVQAMGITVTATYDQISFYKAGGGPVDDFRMAASFVQYYHTISNRTPGPRYIDITANDGTQTSAIRTWTVTLEDSGGMPQLMSSYLQTTENTSFVLSGNNLLTYDSNTPAGSLVYTLESLPTNGRLMLDGVPVPYGGQFTQQQIFEGRLAYRHDLAGTSWDSFSFSVTDGTSTLSNMYFGISVATAGNPVYNNPVNPVNPVNPMNTGPIGTNSNPLGSDPLNQGNTGVNNPINNQNNLLGAQTKELTTEPKDVIANTAKIATKEAAALKEAVDKAGEAGIANAAGAVANVFDNAQQMAARHGLSGDIAAQAQSLTQEGQAGLTDIRQAFSFAMQAYAGGKDASASFLGDVVNAIRQSEIVTARANIAIDGAFEIAARLDGSARAVVQDQIKHVVMFRREVQLANQSLSEIMRTALDAGKAGRFDKAFGDAVESSIRSLVLRNEQLTVNETVLRGLVDSAGGENVDLKQVAETVRLQAEQALQDARSLQDKAAGDESDASIRELLDQQQQEKPVDQPQGRLFPSRDQALEQAAALLALTGSISAVAGDGRPVAESGLGLAQDILSRAKSLIRS